MLDLYQAELARILHLQCTDIGRLANGQALLQPGTTAWEQARDFIKFYGFLYEHHAANGVAMRNWLRRRHKAFGQTPHLMLVDEYRLQELIGHLQEGLS
jgi:hypothetical protein